MMRKYIFIITELLLFLFIFNPLIVSASMLQWGPTTDDVTGYRIYYGVTEGAYTENKDVGLVTEYILNELSLTENTTYFFIVRAYNEAGESEDSNSVSWTVPDITPPLAPAGITYSEQDATLQWIANSDSDLLEYRVYKGTASRSYSPYISNGKETSYSISELTVGQTYYFAVTSVDASNNESGYSNELKVTVDLPSSAGPRLVWVQEGEDISGYKIYYGTASGDYSQYKDVGLVTQYLFDDLTLETGVAYYLIVRAYNEAGESDNSNEVTWTPEAASVADVTIPIVTITSPTDSDAYQTGSGVIDLSGTASDDTGIVQVNWTNSNGEGGQASGTTSWTSSNINLAEGENIVTISALDAAGNEGVDTLAVTYIPPDTISPTVTILSPTTASNYTTDQAILSLSGTSSDNIGVTQVTWNNSVGGSGIATGTLNWSITDIALKEGENIITVQAEDSAGNINGRILIVTYTPPDIIAPAIEIISPTSMGTFTTQTGTIDLSGTSSDNIGVTQVAWSNSQGGNDFADGNESWNASNISLAEGDNIITVTAEDAAGNAAKAELTVTYIPPDVIEPIVQISSPTIADEYTEITSTINLSGTATDNTDVSQVIWSNSLGGSGIASGTAAWSINGLVLHEGDNLITVTAQDAASNTGVDSITVHYAVADTIAPSIKMTSPTAGRFYYTKNNILDISGIASDNKGVAEVVWENSKGGSGTATGTENWSFSGIELSGGRNTITITAIDGAGNKTSIRLYVVYR